MNQIIKRRFNRSYTNYDSNALAQKQIAARLFSLTENFKAVDNLSILEIGCGTGNLTEQLDKLDYNLFIINDLCENYKKLLIQKLPNYSDEGKRRFFIFEDAENLIRNTEYRFDIIASSSMLQWIEEPIRFIKECKERLTERGVIAISTFVPGNLKEIVELTGQGLKYTALEEFRKGLESEFEILSLKEEELVLWFKTPLEVLQHMKLTGVNAISDQMWTKSRLAKFCDEYKERYESEEKLYPLTFKPLYIILRNKK